MLGPRRALPPPTADVMRPIAKPRASTAVQRESVRVGQWAAPGTLELPADAVGLVVYATYQDDDLAGMQSPPWSRVWRSFRLGTLRFDLLSAQEAIDSASAPGIAVLGTRLAEALEGLGQRTELLGLPVGLFGQGGGAAAALLAAALRPEAVRAVVCRDGRTDWAGACLPQVRAPTLLLVAQENEASLGSINRRAMAALTCNKRLATLPRGRVALDRAANADITFSLAGHWFEQHLTLQH